MNWTCLVHFPDDTEAVHLVPGPTPALRCLATIEGTEGVWFVENITLRDFENKSSNGKKVDAKIWVRRLTDEELAHLTG